MSAVQNKGAGSVPNAPDAKETIAAQEASNRNTALLTQQLNQTGQVTNTGSLVYMRDPSNPANVIAQQRLSGPLQNIQDSAFGAIGNNVAASMDQTSQPITLAGIGGNAATAPVGTVGQVNTNVPSYGDFAQTAQQLQQSVLARLQPNMDQQSAQLSTSLRNQGLAPGSEAYNTAQRQLSQTQNDLRLGAVQTADQEQLQQYGAALQGYGAQLGAQQQQYAQAAGNAQIQNSGIAENLANQQAIQAAPLSLAGLALGGGLNGSLGLTNTPTTSVAPTDVLGAYQNSFQDRLAANQENYARAKAMINYGTDTASKFMGAMGY